MNLFSISTFHKGNFINFFGGNVQELCSQLNNYYDLNIEYKAELIESLKKECPWIEEVAGLDSLNPTWFKFEIFFEKIAWIHQSKIHLQTENGFFHIDVFEANFNNLTLTFNRKIF